MKILFSADHHFDEHGRFAECVRVHDFMVDTALAQQIDAFVSCGDIYERASTPRERDAVSVFLTRMANICPVFLAKGNHDRRLDCAIMGKLRSKHPITVCEDVEVIHFQNHPVSLALVAWPERATLLYLTQLRSGIASDAAVDEVQDEVMQTFLRGLGQELAEESPDHDRVRLVAGHFMVDGSVVGTGQPLLGQPLRVSLTDLDHLYADAVVMGHIHMPQAWRTPNGTEVLYTGSPYRTNFGEYEAKSIVLIDTMEQGIKDARLMGSGCYRVTRIPTPCSHMHVANDHWRAHETDDGVEYGFCDSPEMHIDPAEVAGSDIRFRYTVEPDQREPARALAAQWERDWLEAGAHTVKVEPQVLTHGAARAPEIAAAITLQDKLLALWKLRDTTPSADRAERLLRKVHELDCEV